MLLDSRSSPHQKDLTSLILMLPSITDFKLSRKIVKTNWRCFHLCRDIQIKVEHLEKQICHPPLLSLPGYYPHLKKGPLPRSLRVEYIFFKRKKQTKVECASVFQWKGKEKYVPSSEGCVSDPFPAIFPSLYKLRQETLVAFRKERLYETRSREGWVGEGKRLIVSKGTTKI